MQLTYKGIAVGERTCSIPKISAPNSACIWNNSQRPLHLETPDMFERLGWVLDTSNLQYLLIDNAETESNSQKS
jgi:hypothetical protein